MHLNNQVLPSFLPSNFHLINRSHHNLHLVSAELPKPASKQCLGTGFETLHDTHNTKDGQGKRYREQDPACNHEPRRIPGCSHNPSIRHVSVGRVCSTGAIIFFAHDYFLRQSSHMLRVLNTICTGLIYSALNAYPHLSQYARPPDVDLRAYIRRCSGVGTYPDFFAGIPS